jgi:hypothetical protein
MLLLMLLFSGLNHSPDSDWNEHRDSAKTDPGTEFPPRLNAFLPIPWLCPLEDACEMLNSVIPACNVIEGLNIS